MARLAVLASGNGSNFQALVEAIRSRDASTTGSARHECGLLIYDRKAAYVAERARLLGIPSRHISYAGRSREEAESEIGRVLDDFGIDLVALAGFMRLLSPEFVERRRGRIVNVHPSLLPAWPGTDSIRRSHEAGESRYGVSVHFVDSGMDTGSLIAQSEIKVNSKSGLAEIERGIHELEHRLYPRVVLDILDEIEAGRRRA